ncbi:hypothetical protein CGJ25_19575 [Vibrio parahaemolyticus]|uniref:Uncharacterized protein n=1 Tax=Vibrio parahaemolyticus TaxID=670 RepID=A0A227AB10_VIBPH|nr:hypothetical protein BGM07_023035 [Vibrio parahaemolyticus]PWF69662.1 hypothetical protein CCD93_05715 [Vibrio sp. T21]ASZ53151.1 hypothetical protein YA91_22630 [Vibrio parahaemolyticus]ATI46233.1 hypothetical protein CO725_11275 [Vibrio parahaemolyticus]OUD25559.1 hypothetical protein BUN10_04275 [Vibrio parahaemolyticus]
MDTGELAKFQGRRIAERSVFLINLIYYQNHITCMLYFCLEFILLAQFCHKFRYRQCKPRRFLS